MAKSDRAKIFASFSPLKSFDEAIKKREKIIVSKAELLDDRIEEIERELQKTEIGSMVEAIFYKNGEYIKMSGCVSEFCPEQKYFSIVKTKIPFEDLYDFKCE